MNIGRLDTITDVSKFLIDYAEFRTNDKNELEIYLSNDIYQKFRGCLNERLPSTETLLWAGFSLGHKEDYFRFKTIRLGAHISSRVCFMGEIEFSDEGDRENNTHRTRHYFTDELKFERSTIH